MNGELIPQHRVPEEGVLIYGHQMMSGLSSLIDEKNLKTNSETFVILNSVWNSGLAYRA
jgi:hypothetical protein